MRGVDIVSPERAYVSKPNIAFPGTQAQADAVENEAMRQYQAQGTLLGTPPLPIRQAQAALTVPTVVKVGAADKNTGPYVAAIPAEARPGDLLLYLVESDGNLWSNTEGWTEAPFSPGSQGTATQAIAFWARYKPNLRPPQIVGPGAIGTFNHAVGTMLVIRGGRLAVNPFNNHIGQASAVSDTAVSLASGLSSTINNCLILFAIATDTNTSVSTYADANLTGITEVFDDNTASGNTGGLAVVTASLPVAGALGTLTATLAGAATKAYYTLIVSPGASGADEANLEVGTGNPQPTGTLDATRRTTTTDTLGESEPSVTITARLRAAT